VKYLPSLLLLTASCFLLTSPAGAASLESWRFDSSRNQLEFTTDEDVQPTAQLVSDPVRLVIDLPGILLGRPVSNQPYDGAIRSVRVGQFDRQTTRLVIELAPGYTIDPQQVKFRGVTARRWIVQIPTPQPLPPDSAISAGPSTSVNPGSSSSQFQIAAKSPGQPAEVAQIQGVQVTQDGFFIRTSGNIPQPRLTRSRDRKELILDLPGATIAPDVKRDTLIGRYGVNRLQITQIQTQPPIARITFNVNPESPDWVATSSTLGGVAMILAGGASASNLPNRLSGPVSALPPNSSQMATIQSVELENQGSQLIVRADQSITYDTGWDRASGSYRIAINGARLAPNFKRPQLDASSPILRLQLQQETPNRTVILLQPAANVRIGEVNQPSQRMLALQLERSRNSPVLSVTRPPTTTIPVPAISRPPIASIPVPSPPISTTPFPNLPRIPNGRVVVAVDPGHGGPDPGAVGIGGIQEKEIVLDIGRQVAQMLEQQGVQAVLTRSDDRDLDLQPRVDIAEQINATIFVSIHANSIDMSRPDVSGLETYYFESGAELARTIHQSILAGTGIEDRGVRRARFYVLRKTSMPSVLIETGFVTGRNDAARLSNPTYRRQMAASIVQGILQYLRRNS